MLPYVYSYKASCARQGSAVICGYWHPGTLTFSPERQSTQMSITTNDGWTRSGTGRFIAVYPYGNSGRQRVKFINFRGKADNIHRLHILFQQLREPIYCSLHICIFDIHAYAAAGPKAWNQLPVHTRTPETVNLFKTAL